MVIFAVLTVPYDTAKPEHPSTQQLFPIHNTIFPSSCTTAYQASATALTPVSLSDIADIDTKQTAWTDSC